MLSRFYLLRFDKDSCYVIDSAKYVPEELAGDVRFKVVAVCPLGAAETLKSLSDAELAECYGLLM